MNLREEVFGVKVKRGILHQVVVNFLANQRQGTHSTKTKGLIRGGGRKRISRKVRKGKSREYRSPLWRGGGTVFGRNHGLFI